MEQLVLNYGDSIMPDPAISVGNTIHWRLRKFDSVQVMLSLCLDDNSFQTVQLPEHEQDDSLQLCEYKGKLGFIRLRRELEMEYKGKLGFTRLTRELEMELWLVPDSRNSEWIREVVVNLGNAECYGLKPVGFYGAEIVVLKKWGGMVFYKLQDGSHNTVKVEEGIFRKEEKVFQFRSDWELVNLRPPWIPLEKSNVSQSKKTQILLRNNLQVHSITTRVEFEK